LFAPVLDTFVRALPHTYRHTDAPPGTHVRLTITGDAGNTWSLIREIPPTRVGQATTTAIPWTLYTRVETPAAATVTLDQETAWRLFTRGVEPATARERAQIDGDAKLGEVALHTVSIIA
jgi:hypothetical protein